MTFSEASPLPYTSKDKDGAIVIDALAKFAQRHGVHEMLYLIDGVSQAYAPIMEITLDENGEEIDVQTFTVQ